MSEPNTENERLASRLASIALALKPPAKTNGQGSGLTRSTLKHIAMAIAPFVRDAIAEAIAPLEQRLAVMEKKKGMAPLASRVAALEGRPALTYEGVWNEARAYNAGSFVTF